MQKYVFALIWIIFETATLTEFEWNFFLDNFFGGTEKHTGTVTAVSIIFLGIGVGHYVQRSANGAGADD